MMHAAARSTLRVRGAWAALEMNFSDGRQTVRHTFTLASPTDCVDCVGRFGVRWSRGQSQHVCGYA
jgi:hypothetical protein